MLLILSYLFRSLADRWGTTVHFTTSFLHSSWFSAFQSSIFKASPLFDVVFPSFPWGFNWQPAFSWFSCNRLWGRLWRIPLLAYCPDVQLDNMFTITSQVCWFSFSHSRWICMGSMTHDEVAWNIFVNLHEWLTFGVLKKVCGTCRRSRLTLVGFLGVLYCMSDLHELVWDTCWTCMRNCMTHWICLRSFVILHEECATHLKWKVLWTCRRSWPIHISILWHTLWHVKLGWEVVCHITCMGICVNLHEKLCDTHLTWRRFVNLMIKVVLNMLTLEAVWDIMNSMDSHETRWTLIRCVIRWTCVCS